MAPVKFRLETGSTHPRCLEPTTGPLILSPYPIYQVCRTSSPRPHWTTNFPFAGRTETQVCGPRIREATVCMEFSAERSALSSLHRQTPT